MAANPVTPDAPVVVVGARCAGASTAMLLARQGHEVLLVDRAPFPSDTLSTHAISRGGVVQLARWGVLDTVVATGAPVIRSVSFHLSDGTEITRRIKHRAGVDHLIAPRRSILDAILVDAAVASGARFESGVSVTGTTRDAAGRVNGVSAVDRAGDVRHLDASFVVGADGLRSRIARSVDARVVDKRPSDGATHYVYVAGLDTDGFEFHVGPGGFAGVFPTHGGEANVWACTPASVTATMAGDRLGGLLGLLEAISPELAGRVRRARVTSPVRSAVRFPNHVREATGPGWALVGDAGYHRDPITGHGMTDAFRDAELLARHLGRALRGEVTEHEALAGYARQRDEALAPIFDLTVRLSQFPPLDEFVALQKELSDLLDAEAAWLAGLPPLPAAEPVAA